jgi:hypothetical protein
MATKDELIASGALTVIEVELGRGKRVRRELLALREFIQWLDETLPTLACDWDNSDPQEQLNALFETFVWGGPLFYETDFREINPISNGIWELKTPLLRVFGWFISRDCFVCSAGALADLVKDVGLYHGFMREAVWRRGQLGMGKPDFVPGVRIDGVLSDASHG